MQGVWTSGDTFTSTSIDAVEILTSDTTTKDVNIDFVPTIRSSWISVADKAYVWNVGVKVDTTKDFWWRMWTS